MFQKGDWEGVENLVSIMGLNSQSIPAAVLQHLKEHFIAGWVGYPLIGTKEQVVDGLALLARAGFDGIVLIVAALHRRHAAIQGRDFPAGAAGRAKVNAVAQVEPTWSGPMTSSAKPRIALASISIVPGFRLAQSGLRQTLSSKGWPKVFAERPHVLTPRQLPIVYAPIPSTEV